MGDRRAKSFRWRVLLASLVAASLLLSANIEFGAAPAAGKVQVDAIAIRGAGGA